MNIDSMIWQLLDMDIVTEDGTVVFSDEAKELVYGIARQCGSIPVVGETQGKVREYAEGMSAGELYIDMLRKIAYAPTQIHMLMSARMLMPTISQKLKEEAGL